MPLGTFITTATISLAATASTTLTHGLSTTPDMVWATMRSNFAAQSSSAVPLLGLGYANSASITCWNRGQRCASWTIAAAFFHSSIR
mgnify:CR=1 FL=1